MLHYLKLLVLSSVAVLMPIKAVLVAAFVLCLFDLVLGVSAAVRQKQKITSKGLGRSVVKLLVYEIAIIAGFIVQKYLIQDSVPLVNLIGGLIGVTELISVLENVNKINGSNLFAGIIKMLESKSNK